MFAKVKEVLKPEERILYVITEEDMQIFAEHKIGRRLNDDELYSVSKGIESGLGYDIDVVFDTSLSEAIKPGD